MTQFTPEPTNLPATAEAESTTRVHPRSPRPIHPGMKWSGRVLSGLFALFLLGASATPKLLQMPVAEATMAELGWPPGYAFSISILELTCVVLYLIPRTSFLGAVLTTGLLGGAMATQIRAQNPLLSHVLFSGYVGLAMWGGLWLRDRRLRSLFPLTRGSADDQIS